MFIAGELINAVGKSPKRVKYRKIIMRSACIIINIWHRHNKQK